MVDKIQIDLDDQTSIETLTAIAENWKSYPLDECIPCGAVIHMGFFFDGFGRNRDFDNLSAYQRFNAHSVMQYMKHKPKRTPGAFGSAMHELSDSVVQEMNLSPLAS